MKNYFYLLILLCSSCSTAVDYEAEQAAITRLVEEESKLAAAGDYDNWLTCWLADAVNPFMYTGAQGVQSYSDFNTFAADMKTITPFDLKVSRDNYDFVIGKDAAFVSFDQRDNWGGGEERMTKETRTLRKVNGEWKITSVNVVEVSSFDKETSQSFHMVSSKIPPNPKSGFTNLYGIGGMSIGYLNVPEPTDFTPLFAGLPKDMCNSPHWGYIIDGAIRLKYDNGKEETVSAGEVFYWPAPHTAIVDDHVELVDFSPDQEFIPLMDHLAAKMAAQ